MKLAYPEVLARDLENGIGELGLQYEIIPPEYRLRLPVAGIASLAITATLREVGYEAMTIESRPTPGGYQDESHIFSLVMPDSAQPTIIDSTYGSLLRLVGLTPEEVLKGRKDMYPSEKILSFDLGDVDTPAAELIMGILKVLEDREFNPSCPQQPHPFDSMSSHAVYRVLSEFWNSLHFREYAPDESTVKAAKYLQGSLRHIGVLMDEDQVR